MSSALQTVASLAVPLRNAGVVDLPGVGELRLRAGKVTMVRQTRAIRVAFQTGVAPTHPVARALWDGVHEGPVDVVGIGVFRLGFRAGYVTYNPVDGSPIRIAPRLDLVLDGASVEQDFVPL